MTGLMIITMNKHIYIETYSKKKNQQDKLSHTFAQTEVLWKTMEFGNIILGYAPSMWIKINK